MPQTDALNRRFVLAERPKGEPALATLRLETVPVPAPGRGQMLMRNDYLSPDPNMRGRICDAPSYAAPVITGGVMEGGTVAEVVPAGACRSAGLSCNTTQPAWPRGPTWYPR